MRRGNVQLVVSIIIMILLRENVNRTAAMVTRYSLKLEPVSGVMIIRMLKEMEGHA